MRFITDGMLGKLTRWLRLLGHDVEYANDIEDKKLMTMAKKEERVLLTQDLELFQQAIARGIDAFLVKGRTEVERIACTARKFELPLEVDMTVSRCPKCGTIVKAVRKDAVANKIPKTTFKHYDNFWECSRCGQIYWRGAHWKRIAETLEDAKKMNSSEN